MRAARRLIGLRDNRAQTTQGHTRNDLGTVGNHAGECHEVTKQQTRVFVGGLALLAVLSVAFWAVGSKDDTRGDDAVSTDVGVRMIGPRDLSDRLTNGEVFVINVHVPYEGRIPGTNAEIPYTDIEAQQARLPQDKSAPVVVYCMSGRMSEIAAQSLIRLGYTNVFDLSGGMLAWDGQGLPLEDWTR